MSKVLIVDDESSISEIYKIVFSTEGFEVMIAVDGVDGLDKLKIYNPDIILLDIMMPRMNGIEFLKQIKTMDLMKNIPVIIISNLVDSKQQEVCLQLGAIKYIIKSDLLPTEIVKMVKETIGTK